MMIVQHKKIECCLPALSYNIPYTKDKLYAFHTCIKSQGCRKRQNMQGSKLLAIVLYVNSMATFSQETTEVATGKIKHPFALAVHVYLLFFPFGKESCLQA